MAKKHENGTERNGGEYVCERGKWTVLDSHIRSLELVTRDKQKVNVPQHNLLGGKQTESNPRGWRYWSRRVIPAFTNEMDTVSAWLDEIEKFDACDSLYVPTQAATEFHPEMKESRVTKSYRIMADAKGNPVSRQQFEKLMVVGAVALASQKALQLKLRSRAMDEQYKELNLEKPVAGTRRARTTEVEEVHPEDLSEGLDN